MLVHDRFELTDLKVASKLKIICYRVPDSGGSIKKGSLQSDSITFP